MLSVFLLKPGGNHSSRYRCKFLLDLQQCILVSKFFNIFFRRAQAKLTLYHKANPSYRHTHSGIDDFMHLFRKELKSYKWKVIEQVVSIQIWLCVYMYFTDFISFVWERDSQRCFILSSCCTYMCTRVYVCMNNFFFFKYLYILLKNSFICTYMLCILFVVVNCLSTIFPFVSPSVRLFSVLCQTLDLRLCGYTSLMFGSLQVRVLSFACC